MTRRITLLALICACFPLATAMAQWTTAGDGIEFQQFRLSNPDNDAYVARMNPTHANATIESMLAYGRVYGSTSPPSSVNREITSSQAARMDDAISAWGSGWGQRNDVVVAINGSYFNTSTGVITGGHLLSGWYAKRFDPNSGQSGFAWKRDRSYFMSNCTRTVAGEQNITWTTSGTTQSINGVNVARGSDQLIVYTPQFDSYTRTDNTGSEVLVQLNAPAGLTYSGVTGTVREIRANQGSSNIPFDHVVLSAKGTPATTMLNRAQVGGTVVIRQSCSTVGLTCQEVLPYTLENTFAMANGNHVYLRNSTIIPNSDAGFVNRNPRTAIGYSANYVFFIVVDGRTTQSLGMSIVELGDFTRNVLGATDAVNMDGGGSSAIIVNGVIRNNPSDGAERTVANGMMMVNLLPKQQSSQFTAGQSAYTIAVTNSRLGPGTNYAGIATIASGLQGTILDHPVAGVYAKGDYWWKCNFGGTVGWVPQSALSPNQGEPPPTITQHPTAQAVCPGSTATFTLTATGSGTLSYQWQKNLSNLTNGGHYAGCTTPTLTVSNAAAADAASYRCVVTDTNGSSNSNAAALTLKAATAITQHPSNQSVFQGLTATFTVSATGEGTLSYQWQKNGSNLTNGGHYAGCTTATLTVSNTDGGDVANYRCVVSAGCGSATSNAASLALTQPGDFDSDGDVDLADFALIQKCLAGDYVPITDPACMEADMDGTTYIDANDIVRFINCMSGPEIPANPGCMLP